MLVLHLSTYQSVLLAIVAFAITLFFVMGAAVMIASLGLISRIKKVVAKAEDAIESVEEATETIKNIGAHVGGPMTVFKVIKSITDAVNGKKK